MENTTDVPEGFRRVIAGEPTSNALVRVADVTVVQSCPHSYHVWVITGGHPIGFKADPPTTKALKELQFDIERQLFGSPPSLAAKPKAPSFEDVLRDRNTRAEQAEASAFQSLLERVPQPPLDDDEAPCFGPPNEVADA